MSSCPPFFSLRTATLAYLSSLYPGTVWDLGILLVVAVVVVVVVWPVRAPAVALDLIGAWGWGCMVGARVGLGWWAQPAVAVWGWGGAGRGPGGGVVAPSGPAGRQAEPPAGLVSGSGCAGTPSIM